MGRVNNVKLCACAAAGALYRTRGNVLLSRQHSLPRRCDLHRALPTLSLSVLCVSSAVLTRVKTVFFALNAFIVDQLLLASS